MISYWSLAIVTLVHLLVFSWYGFFLFIKLKQKSVEELEANDRHWDFIIKGISNDQNGIISDYVAMVEQLMKPLGAPVDTARMGSYKRINISKTLRFDILVRDDFKCQTCGRTLRDGVSLEVDHKMPVSKGGTNSPDNLWTLCNVCNSGKSDKVVDSIVMRGQ